MEITKAHKEAQTEYYARKAMHNNKIETLILRYIKQGILKKRPVRAENVVAYVLANIQEPQQKPKSPRYITN